MKKAKRLSKKRLYHHLKWVISLAGGWQWCSLCGASYHPGPGAKWEYPKKEILSYNEKF